MQTVLLLHGALGSPADFEASIDFFLKHNLKPLIPDLPLHGHFASPWPTGDLDELAQFLHNYLQKMGAKPNLVLGHSLGGMIALKYQTMYADSPFKKIVTYGTKFDWSPESAKKESEKLNPSFLKDRAPEVFKKFESIHPNLEELIVKMQTLMKKLGDNPPLAHFDFSKVNVPVLILRGAEDHMVTKNECDQAEKLLPFGRALEIPKHKHAINKADFSLLYTSLNN